MPLEFKFVEQTFKVRDQEITFIEKIAYDENGEEVYHRETEMENDIKLYDIYKQRSGLLTTTELKELREKHNLSQKELAEKIYKLKFLLGTSCCVGNPLNIGISTCILYKKLNSTYIGREEREIYRYENGTIQSKEIDKLIRDILIKGDE